MSKKMKIPTIFKNREPNPPWQWPSCTQPKTLSFRATNDDVFKTVNSVFLDLESPESLFTNSSQCPSFSTDELSEEINGNDSIETMIQRIRLSDRLFFEPGDTSSTILKEDKNCNEKNGQVLPPFKESVALALESDDPYSDFKKSMEEMIESHGLKDWDCLEELLGWYLKTNGKINHGFIVGAFVDLLVGLDQKTNCDTIATSNSKVSVSHSTSYSSAASSLSSSPSSPSCSVTRVGCEIEIDCKDRDNGTSVRL